MSLSSRLAALIVVPDACALELGYAAIVALVGVGPGDPRSGTERQAATSTAAMRPMATARIDLWTAPHFCTVLLAVRTTDQLGSNDPRDSKQADRGAIPESRVVEANARDEVAGYDRGERKRGVGDDEDGRQ
jgi:hypothetical protein